MLTHTQRCKKLHPQSHGTFPMQSERMYAALKRLGKDVRLVMLPYEAHGYRARKSLLHVLWEQEQWLDKYLLNDTAEPVEVITEPVVSTGQ